MEPPWSMLGRLFHVRERISATMTHFVLRWVLVISGAALAALLCATWAVFTEDPRILYPFMLFQLSGWHLPAFVAAMILLDAGWRLGRIVIRSRATRREKA